MSSTVALCILRHKLRKDGTSETEIRKAMAILARQGGADRK